MASSHRAREPEGLGTPYALRLLDTGPHDELDGIARICALACDSPYASVTLIDQDDHYTVASYGGEGADTAHLDTPLHDALCAYAIANRDVVHSADVQGDRRLTRLPTPAPGEPVIRMFASAPISTRDGIPVGTLRISDSVVRRLSSRQLQCLTDLANQAMRLLELHGLAHDLRHLALHDELTGLPNRRALTGGLRQGSRQRGTIAYLDLNDFKKINDTAGHAAGDEVLRVVARRLRAAVREDDTVIRMGGDEFLVWTGQDAEPGDLRARLAAALDDPIMINGEHWTVTASIGTVRTNPNRTAADHLSWVDERMYERKRSRRTAIGV